MSLCTYFSDDLDIYLIVYTASLLLRFDARACPSRDQLGPLLVLKPALTDRIILNNSFTKTRHANKPFLITLL